MADNLLLDEFIKPFEAFAPNCRRIDDDIVIFRRDGSIVGSRCQGDILRSEKSFFSLIDSRDSALLTDLCISFDYSWFIADTSLGCAAIYTDLFGVSGLLIAVIFHEKRGAVKSFFIDREPPLTYFLPSFEALESTPLSQKSSERLKNTLALTESALSLRFLKTSLKTAGLGAGELITRGLLEVAEFCGCVGHCVASFKRIPDLDKFSPELFSALSLCAVIFARYHGVRREFHAKIAEYNGLVAILFSIDLKEPFDIKFSLKPNGNLPEACAEIASRRDCFLSYRYIDDGKKRLDLWFVPQNDPLPGRGVKQDPDEVIKIFWEE